MIEIIANHEQWPLARPFTIARGTRTMAEVVTVTLREGALVGRGECQPSSRYGETVTSVMGQIARISAAVGDGLGREGLLEAMPAGAARNALDCAMWDLESKRHRVPVRELAGIAEPEAVVTCYTISLDTPAAMRAQARENAWRAVLKLKLAGTLDVERVQAVREGAPGARIVVDANESWSATTYRTVAPVFRELGVSMIEQPFAAGADAELSGERHDVPLCADESCHDRATLASLVGRYEMINIKLDKTGGLTEALCLKAAAERAGLAIMVGCMLGTSLAMAPALLLTPGASVVDLDGPLLLSSDRPDGLLYEGSTIRRPERCLWG